MDASELAEKFQAKMGAVANERNRQSCLASEFIDRRSADIEYCKTAMENNVPPFLAELQDHRAVGVSFIIGDGGTATGVASVYRPDAEPFISNAGELTRDKIAKLIEMVIDNTQVCVLRRAITRNFGLIVGSLTFRGLSKPRSSYL